MSLSYFNVKKLRRQSKQQDSLEAPTSPVAATVTSPSEETATSPVLDEEDQKFLERLTAISQEPEGVPPALPNRPVVILDNGETKVGGDAQEALMDGADKVPLPTSPPEVVAGGAKSKEKGTDSGKKSVMSYFALAQNKFKRNTNTNKSKEDKKEKRKDKLSDKDREKAANDLLSAAESSKSPEEKKEEQELTAILDQLNLSAVNNRVFSFSKESEELLGKFTLVLKDVVNGVPTAYDDLEKLFTDYDNQLKKMYGSLPPFLQNMVKSLPAKITATLGPEILAAQAEKPGFDAKQRASASRPQSKRARIPSLKSLISAQGAVATMLRSILNFLKLRFPLAVSGTNVLMSLAVLLLLFVFWYCHKRGRETRLEREAALAAAGADPALDSSASFTDDGDSIVEKSTEGESSKKHEAEKEKAEPPLIIHDNKEATVEDMPSVSHLPDPNSAAVPQTSAKEEPAQVLAQK